MTHQYRDKHRGRPWSDWTDVENGVVKFLRDMLTRPDTRLTIKRFNGAFKQQWRLKP